MSVAIRQTMKSAVVAGGIALMLLGSAGSVFAANPAPREQGAAHGMMDPQKVDQKLTTLKGDLKITEAQTPAWNAVADAVRTNANAMRTAAEAKKASGKQTDVLKRMESRDQWAKLRAQNSERLLTAFRPLYAQLNDEQKQVASQKLMQHHKHGQQGQQKKAG
ncbi:MAG: Spy/CpxP family protein refolding chaperone [Alphaproteobacteria bacterium]|nr:Spy/CpxP family protein refolding chaperone [Alphaproteobacteria bacterium]